jgi:hypothetical protein
MSGRGKGGKGLGKATMSSEAMSARKRKAASQVPEADVSIVDQSNGNVMGVRNCKPDEVISSDNWDDQSNTKVRQVARLLPLPPTRNLPVENESASETEDGETVSDATQEAELMERIGQIIQDLFHSDTTKASTALDVLE